MHMQIRKVLAVGCALLVFTGMALHADDKKKETALKKIEPEKVNLGRPVNFEQDIYPILEANCIACHNLAIDESKLDLEEVAGILKGGKRGPAVVPKDPDKSLLFQVASHLKKPAMPPMPNKVDADTLTPKQLGLIRQWILEGASAGMGSKSDMVVFRPLPQGLNAIYSVALSRWGRLAAAGRANQINIYDVSTGDELARLVDPNLIPIQHENKPMYPRGAAHRDFVHSLAFSPDGNLLASGGYRVVKLWQRPRNVHSLKIAAPNAVTAVVVSPDRKLIAFGTTDNTISISNLVVEKVMKTLSGHTGQVTGLQFSSDGSKLFSSSLDKSIRVWNVADGKQRGQFTTPSPVNDLALNKDATQVISAGADNLLRVWKLPAVGEASSKPTLEIKGHTKSVTSVELISPAGTQIVSGSEDGTVRIWTLSNGKQVRSMNHGGPVTDVASRPDGQRVASSGANNIAKLWQVSDGKQLAELKGDLNARSSTAGSLEREAVAKQKVTLTGNAFKAGEKNLKDRQDGFKKATEAKTKADKAVADAGPKVKTAEAALKAAQAELEKKKDDKKLKKKVDDATKKVTTEQANLKKATNTQTSAARSLTQADKAVVTAKKTLEEYLKAKDQAAANQKVAAESLKTVQQAEKAAEKPIRSLAFSPDGKRLATAGDDNLLHVWNSEDGTALEVYQGHTQALSGVVYVSENALLSASADKTIIVWNTKPQWKLIGQLGPPEDAPLELGLSPFVNRVLALDFSDDGKLLATGGGYPSRSGELMIWDVGKQSLIRQIQDAHSDTVLGVDFSQDGNSLLSGASDKFAKQFEVATGNFVRSFEGHTHHVLDVSWKLDGTSISTAGADNVVKVWNVETGEQRRTIGGYSKQVTSVQYIGVGENVVSCSGDKQVRFHRTGNGQAYRSFDGGTDFMYTSAAARSETSVIANVNNEATIVIAGGEDGVLRMWNGGNAKSIRTIEPPKPPADQTAQADASGKK
jgi:WD40 repeat protein